MLSHIFQDISSLPTQRLELLLRDGSTKAHYKPGVGIVGTTNASRWNNALGSDIALVLPGVAANYASTPDHARLDIVGDIDLRVKAALNDYSPATSQTLIAKRATNQIAYHFFLDSSGVLVLYWSEDLTTGKFAVSTATLAATGMVDFSTYTFRATLDVDAGAANKTVSFYYSTDDGASWNAVGLPVPTAGTTSIANSTALVEVGAYTGGTLLFSTGKFYRAQIYDGIAGTLVFDANFAAQARETTSFAESAAGATVTINSTAIAVPARIGDATDLTMDIVDSRPAIEADMSLTFDGTADYLKTAAFTLNQPTTVYLVGKQVTWTLNDRLFDGNSSLSMSVFQNATTPNLILYAGASITENTTLPVNQNSVMTGIFNGASSSLKIDSNAATTGDAGASNAGGFTLGSVATGAAQWANIQVKEIIIRNVADSAATQAQIQALLRSIHGTP